MIWSRYTGLILAGGSNRRFSYPKGLIKTPEGKTLIQTNAALLQKFFPEVILSTNTPEVYFGQGIAMVGDLYPERGPLGGIFSGLIAYPTEGVFVVACDMPSVKEDVVGLILRYASEGPVVVCQFGGRVHPLLGLYKREIIPIVEPLLQVGPVRMVDFLKDIGAVKVPESIIKESDPEGQSFRNINTPQDLERYL